MLLNLKKIGFLGLLAVTFSTNAFAITNLKKVQITDGSQIDLFFDGKVSPSQIRTEFFNDIIQISLTDTSVYPAKINSVSGMDLTKVFAYQYAPKLVRCRLSVKGKAESYQGRFHVTNNGKVLSLRISGGTATAISDKITHTAAAATTAVAAKSSVSAVAPESAPVEIEEKALLEKVMKSEARSVEKKDSARESDSKDSDSEESPTLTGFGKKSTSNKTLGGAKPLPSPFRSLGVLIVVIGLFGLMMLMVKKVRDARSGASANLEKHKGFKGLFGQFAKMTGNLAGSMGGKGKMMETVATHYLGPKKSIAMVRISGRMLVLGVTNESINLITEFAAPGADGEIEDEAAEPFSVAKFAGGLKNFENNSEAAGPTALSKVMAQSLMAGQMGSKSAAKNQPVAQALQGAAQKYSNSAAGAAPQSGGAGPSVFSDYLSAESSKPSVRAQIRNRVEGMKQL